MVPSSAKVMSFRPLQPCKGMENNLTECGGVDLYKDCVCTTVAVIKCPAGKISLSLV